ncbi:hypothetical protein QUF58_03640 [Anaerolineales bacterium HSG24]|nr:hypothetical protein [Anaerolineales bacterium HSG24]
MRWKNQWPEREPRPKVKKLSNVEKKKILATFEQGIETSPVLSALDVQVYSRRGRFYFEKEWQISDELLEIETIGRVTPLAEADFGEDILLEVEKNKGNWYSVIQGTAEAIIKKIANDTKGTFHGLGVLNQNLSNMVTDLIQMEVEMQDELEFVYTETGTKCTTQEALFHFFGTPIDIIAEPRQWYIYHRTPTIVEVSEDRSSVLVQFTANSFSDSFGGRCLYVKKDNEWDIFIIKPNQSSNIITATTWLEKRNWEEW